jgi:Peptidase family C25/FlgD Ig-like domain
MYNILNLKICKIGFITIIYLTSLVSVIAQSTISLRQRLNWSDKPIVHNANRFLWHFDKAVYSETKTPTLPVFTYRFPLPSEGRLLASFKYTNFSPIDTLKMESNEIIDILKDEDYATLTDEIRIKTFVSQEKFQYFGNISFIPLRKKDNILEKLLNFDLAIDFYPDNRLSVRSHAVTKESVLKEGDIYKFSIKETGIIKLDYNFLKNQLKIANIDQIDPRTIKLLGNGGGMLPEHNSGERTDDLIENNILIVGEEDGKFDAMDFILFYGVGPDKWYFDTKTKLFNRPKNIYADESFYFIKINSGNGARVTTQTSVPNTPYSTTTFNDFSRFEEDKINLLASQRCNCTQGSGKLWFGEAFTGNVTERDYTNKFNFPNIVTTEPVTISVQFVGRSSDLTNFKTAVAGKTFLKDIFPSDNDPTEGTIANLQTLTETFKPTNDNLDIKINYPATTNSEGWLDFIEVNCRRRLQLSGSQMAFRDIKSLEVSSVTYQVSNLNNNALIWDITNPQKPKNQEFALNNNIAIFGANTEGGVLKTFIVFDKNAIALNPTAAIGKINNQNLHAFDDIDLLIVYHKDFETAAKTLSEHRKKQGLSVQIAEVKEVYNEFSSGALDPTAIRDFARLLHKRSSHFKYLLLMGDGSFDYKRIYPLGNLQPSDFIPPYETDESFNGISAFPSDDYYGLLSDTEGVDLQGDLDIAVGRIVCKTPAEANNVVNKILHYESPKVLGDWHNRAMFIADDEDYNYHLNDADEIANMVIAENKNFNVEKLYVDAFRQEVSAGGTRVPALNEAIAQNQFKGLLTMCYLGHGGPKRLAQEAVITREDMAAWRNLDKLPIFVTATCSFSGYDNPKEESAGEIASLNPNGGMVALLSTVRAVYASSNATLTMAVFDTIFKKINNRVQTIGEVIVAAKNISRTGANGNKFTLIGDPSMPLALPRYTVSTLKINNKNTDTVRALQRITLEGAIVDDNGNILKNFNGTLYPTVYDKPAVLRTLGQDPTSIVRDFSVQRNIIFKGTATIKNGTWQFTFVAPSDIDYTFGNGKISYYATDGAVDAVGNFENLIIGGTELSLKKDDTPPLVQVFMNNEQFISGGTTNANPLLFVKLSDDTGINTTGISIGHDLVATLDSSNSTILLNNFYEAVKDDHTKGLVRYPLNKLGLGLHKIRVKAWDIANNAGEGSTEFIVASDVQSALNNVLSYPNPTRDKAYFQFKHNVEGQELSVNITIFAINGQLVKTINQDVASIDNLVSDIEWDGKNEAGQSLTNGIYVYKIVLSSKGLIGTKIKAESKFEKIVIIK